ncbi:glycosyltransferase [Bacteriovorax sp. Seq25_V]|uniref:glycosyltransferase n=1 Tax=Bacteriovorax sp. Seq25_V TaxID=1201288 RepID=UPI000389DF60|nr:glycosyltransferase [Bacteriovorax sp. Seq25_V]EQC43237.1 glycosyltransferase, group 1 family protein [Bacteriovorax sp. Seq25_V]
MKISFCSKGAIIGTKDRHRDSWGFYASASQLNDRQEAEITDSFFLLNQILNVIVLSMTKVVLLHDWLTGFRGGERVLEAFCEMFPDAPIYTLIHDKGSTSAIIESKKITSSFLNSIPGIGKHYRKFLPLFPMAAESIKILEDADLILSSSHCVIKGVKKPFRAKHISYVHSPMRYLYDQFDVYFGKDAPFYQRQGIKVFKNYLTRWDIDSNKNVDVMIGNSFFVAQRIKQYYNINASVIHPFVDLKDFRPLQSVETPKEDYYVMVTAFAPNKRVDLAIECFNKLGKKLHIIGGGQQEKMLKEMAGPTITFFGNLTRDEVIDQFRKAKALIFPGVEDFGITPLESLASGTPVIAYKFGGVLETLNDEVAEFFTEQTPDALIKAIENFEWKNFDKSKLFARAEEFSKETFKSRILDIIERTLS